MAIPLQNIGRHVFLAFNFEAHYGLADNNTFSPSDVKHWVRIDRKRWIFLIKSSSVSGKTICR